jgi:hypothetical protein
MSVILDTLLLRTKEITKSKLDEPTTSSIVLRSVANISRNYFGNSHESSIHGEYNEASLIVEVKL